MTAPIYYRWDDAQAPVARGERRSLCDILHACLVTGYGTKPAAGWTREYVNATFDVAVFRNNSATGTGFYLRVDGLSPSTAGNYKLMAYETMTSVDNGLFPFSATAKDFRTSNQPGTTAHPWIVVADDRFCWMTCWDQYAITPTGPTSNDIAKSEMLFGDIVKWRPSDAYGCILEAAAGAGHFFRFGSPNQAADANFAMPRRANGAAGSITPALIRGGGPGTDSVPGGDGLAYSIGDPILVSRPHLNDATVYTLRGWIPGLYYPCHPNAFGQLAKIQVDGKTFLSIRGFISGGYSGNYFIDLGDWRA